MPTELSQRITKRRVQLVLGTLWLLDGLLQLQPQMFTRNFATQVIAPVSEGQPAFVQGPVHFVVEIILHRTVLWGVCFAAIQLALGALIVWKRTVKIGLLASVVWGLVIWYLGEGLGGLLTGQAMLFMGAPGAALLYAVIALGVLPSKDNDSTRPASWLAYVWMGLWAGAGLLMLWSQARPKDIAAMIMDMGSGAPGWLTTIDRHASHWIGSKPDWVILLFVGVDFAIGLAVLLPRYIRFGAIGAGLVLSVIYWFVGQDLGMYYSGLVTDLSTAPLVILLGLAILGAPEVTLRPT